MTMRIVQVGMGGSGRVWARDYVPLVDDVELVGCVDRDQAALRMAQDEVGIAAEHCYTSLADALDALDPDAVLITADTGAHVSLAMESLGANKHVLMEKPFAPSLEQARTVVEAAESRGLVLMINQNYRYFPAVHLAAQMARERNLGLPGAVYVDFRRHVIAPGGKPIRLYTVTQPLLLDMAIHHFDLMRHVLGEEPVAIDCHAWNPPWSPYRDPACALATIEFDGGAVVSYRGSWVSPGPRTAWAGEWRVECEGGEIAWTSRSDLKAQSADRVSVRPLGEEAREVELPAVAHEDRAGALAEFAAAVRTGREPQSSGRENLRSLALAFAAVAAATTGARVELPSDPVAS